MSYYIYKICCDDLPDFVYVGSTKAFRQRKSDHKMSCEKNIDRKLYNTIRENGGWKNWRMVIIEECGEISFTQARIKEEEQRVKLNADLNMLRCHRTEEERKEQNKEYHKEYYENNKEHIKEQNKEYMKEYREKNKEHAKEYYENNIEHIKERIKEYYEKNKEQILNWKSKKIDCECGGIYTNSNKSIHFKTNRHLKYVESLEKIN